MKFYKTIHFEGLLNYMSGVSQLVCALSLYRVCDAILSLTTAAFMHT